MRRLVPVVAIMVGLSAAAPASAVVLGANGKILYTLQTPGNFDIWATQPDGSGNVPLITDAANDQGGSWSPDGTKIVFRSDRTGGGDIYVADADGNDPVRLTTDPAQESHPSFSPDGTKIVFTRKDPDDEIFVMNADGSDAVRRTNNTVTDAGPEFSPDGTRIAYFSGNNVIHVMNADGSNPHPLDPGQFLGRPAVVAGRVPRRLQPQPGDGERSPCDQRGRDRAHQHRVDDPHSPSAELVAGRGEDRGARRERGVGHLGHEPGRHRARADPRRRARPQRAALAADPARSDRADRGTHRRNAAVGEAQRLDRLERAEPHHVLLRVRHDHRLRLAHRPTRRRRHRSGSRRSRPTSTTCARP